MIKEVTANLVVDRIEPSADFFAKVGFEINMQVPEGNHMGFALLKSGDAQLMYQTRESLKEDSATFEKAYDGRTPSMLFITVEDVAAVETSLAGYKVMMPMRDTFYGAREITYEEPGGHYVTFAEFAEDAGSD